MSARGLEPTEGTRESEASGGGSRGGAALWAMRSVLAQAARGNCKGAGASWAVRGAGFIWAARIFIEWEWYCCLLERWGRLRSL